jgi:hypothetical protein
MKFLFMALLPILIAGIMVSLTEKDQMIILWISIAAVLATLDSYLYEKFISPKIPVQNPTLTPDNAQ